MLKEYIVKNEIVVQSQAVSWRNLKNQIGQLATILSNRPQGSLPSNTKDPRRDGKEQCKVINLRSRKGVDILIGMSKKRMEFVPTREKTQIEEEWQQPFANILVRIAKLQQLQKDMI